MLLWSRNVTDSDLLVNIILSCYLIVGARIEETRLTARMGERYILYLSAVPGFIPRRIPRLGALLRSAIH
jgi:protein-S-isoprenylcysteine O-methyltransferase Ste14